MVNTYKAAGVDLQLDDVCKAFFAEACVKSFKNNKHAKIINLADEGLHRVQLIKVGKQYFMLNSDGIGTKIEVAERMQNHTTMGHDLVAMLVDDAVRFGARPIAMVNDLNVAQLDKDIARQLAMGLQSAAYTAGIIIIGGEIAQLKGRVAGYIPAAYNWSGTLLSWVPDQKKVITGEKIQPGQTVLAIRENGYKSNGLSLTRRILEQQYGKDWHYVKFEGGTLGEAVLRPSKICAPGILEALEIENNGITGIVNVTGQGIPGKLGRLLGPSHLGAHLGRLWAPPLAMSYVKELGKVTDKEAYNTWNMGNGALVITRKPKKAMKAITKAGYEIREAGTITLKPEITIKTYKGNTISYEVK